MHTADITEYAIAFLIGCIFLFMSKYRIALKISVKDAIQNSNKVHIIFNISKCIIYFFYILFILKYIHLSYKMAKICKYLFIKFQLPMSLY